MKADARITRLYELHHAEVLAYCVRRIGRAEADDVASEVFTVAWRRIDQVDPATARAWLFGVARGVIANSWRSSRRRARLVGKVSGLAPPRRELPDDLALRRSEDDEVLVALRRLRVADREVLMLAAWEELTGPEIAQALGITVVAAEQRLHRAKRRLARVLRPATTPITSPLPADSEGGD